MLQAQAAHSKRISRSSRHTNIILFVTGHFSTEECPVFLCIK